MLDGQITVSCDTKFSMGFHFHNKQYFLTFTSNHCYNKGCSFCHCYFHICY